MQYIIDWVSGMVASGTDLVVSVHPFCNHLLLDAVHEVAEQKGVPAVPVATVVTDLGSAHISWFDPRASAVVVPTDALRTRAIDLGVDPSIVHVCGLPVRQGFWTPLTESKQDLKRRLGLASSGEENCEDLVVLLMAGGEGFGALEAVAIAVGRRLADEGLGRLVVACGKNEATLTALQAHPWPTSSPAPILLGFVGNIDEYMSAADVLMTKAGPGSIAEASIRGLPCLLTSFMPGQEDGNIDYVRDAGAGEYVSDQDPSLVADRLSEWLHDRPLLKRMSECARALARPEATLQMAELLGSKLLRLEASEPPAATQ
jgi:1,2-diacylglycerol 3-beta-galactosyltransferase